jgi:hypothetical protein
MESNPMVDHYDYTNPEEPYCFIPYKPIEEPFLENPLLGNSV